VILNYTFQSFLTGQLLALTPTYKDSSLSSTWLYGKVFQCYHITSNKLKDK